MSSVAANLLKESFIPDLINSSFEFTELFDNQLPLEGHFAFAPGKTDVRNGEILCPIRVGYGVSVITVHLQDLARLYSNFQFAFRGVSDNLYFGRHSPSDRVLLQILQSFQLRLDKEKETVRVSKSVFFSFLGVRRFFEAILNSYLIVARINDHIKETK
jgi:hypothetical protein